MTIELSSDDRRQIIDRILELETGLLGDQRDEIPEPAPDPELMAFLKERAQLLRAALEVMPDDKLFDRCQHDLQAKLALDEKIREQEERDRRSHYQTFSERGVKARAESRQPDCITEACLSFRKRGLTANEGFKELCTNPFVTEGGRYTVSASASEGRVIQTDTVTNENQEISFGTFQTRNWVKAGKQSI
jgi:hypothetical protein